MYPKIDNWWDNNWCYCNRRSYYISTITTALECCIYDGWWGFVHMNMMCYSITNFKLVCRWYKLPLFFQVDNNATKKVKRWFCWYIAIIWLKGAALRLEQRPRGQLETVLSPKQLPFIAWLLCARW